jgi:hypothetical protein
MWVYKSYCIARMTLHLADRTCVVWDWVRGDHPRTAVTNKELVPYTVDLSLLTFSFDYPTASSRTQFLSADFCYSCASRVDVPRRINGTIHFTWQAACVFRVTKMYRDLGSTCQPVAGVHHIPCTHVICTVWFWERNYWPFNFKLTPLEPG